jgi:hypothetical protein
MKAHTKIVSQPSAVWAMDVSSCGRCGCICSTCSRCSSGCCQQDWMVHLRCLSVWQAQHGWWKQHAQVNSCHILLCTEYYGTWKAAGEAGEVSTARLPASVSVARCTYVNCMPDWVQALSDKHDATTANAAPSTYCALLSTSCATAAAASIPAGFDG